MAQGLLAVEQQLEGPEGSHRTGKSSITLAMEWKSLAGPKESMSKWELCGNRGPFTGHLDDPEVTDHCLRVQSLSAFAAKRN